MTETLPTFERLSLVWRMVNPESPGRGERGGAGAVHEEQPCAVRPGVDCGLPDTAGERFDGEPRGCEEPRGHTNKERGQSLRGGFAAARSHWDSAIWLPCADGKARRIEPGISPLAYGVPGRVGLLRGYGNAIVPQTAAAFITAFIEAKGQGGA